MDELLQSYETADHVFSKNLGFGGIFGGFLLTIALLWTCRVLVRAYLQSWLGLKNGTFISGVVEFVVSMGLALTTYENPGTIMATIGWNAALFKQLLLALKG